MDIYEMRKHNTIIGQKCDSCGIDNCTGDGSQVSIHLNFGWGHDLDGAQYDFCSYKCLLQFIIEEIKKSKPKDNRFEFGTEQKENK